MAALPQGRATVSTGPRRCSPRVTDDVLLIVISEIPIHSKAEVRLKINYLPHLSQALALCLSLKGQKYRGRRDMEAVVSEGRRRRDPCHWALEAQLSPRPQCWAPTPGTGGRHALKGQDIGVT